MRCLSQAILILLISSVCQQVFANDWYIEKKLSISASSRFSGDNKLTTQVNSVGLKAEYQGDSLAFNFDAHWQYDAVYDWHSAYSEAAEDEYRSRLWVDESYVSWNWSDIDLSLGYQKVVWGEADDLRVVDVINPLDLKDFVLFDIDDYRISLPMLRAEKTISSWDIEALWILASEPNNIPPAGSEFDLGLPDLPESEVDDPEFGIRAQSFFWSTDVSLYAFRGYNDSPVLIASTIDDIHYEYYKETMLGTSLSRPLGDWIIRSELAWFDDREFNTLDASQARSDVTQWLVGIDYLYRDWLFSAQVTDRNIKDWNNNYTVERSEPLYTLSSDANFASGTIAIRFAVSHADYAGGGELYQSKLTYQPNEYWAWRLHIDALSGEPLNFFGQFQDKDRVWLSMAYTF